MPTAMRSGWLRKEGKGNKAFKRRFFVLWSTSEALLRAGESLEGKRNATPDDNVLVYYESPGQLSVHCAVCTSNLMVASSSS